MKIQIRTAVGVGLLALALSLPASAQTKTGTTVGQFLLIEPSARMAGMGNAGVASFDEITAAYYNPGAIGHMPSSDVVFTHSSWLAGITYDCLAAGIPPGSATTLFLRQTSLHSGAIDARTGDQPSGPGEGYPVQTRARARG